MLYDPNLRASTRPALPFAIEFKSAERSATACQAARRYRPRRTTGDRVREALMMLAQSRADLVTHEEKAWNSITFAGTRHEVKLEFHGAEAVAAGEAFIEALPEHEFAIPGQLVADATVREIDHRFGLDERMVVTAVLLLLEES